MSIRRRTFALVALLGVVTSLLGWVTGPLRPTPAAAAGTPDVSLTVTNPPRALIGETASFVLRACNPTGTDGFNGSYRAVLPVGASVTSTSPAADIILTDQPTSGRTTVIWLNTADLLAGACASVTVVVATDSDNDQSTLPVGSDITIDAGVYVNSDAFFVPDFDEVTGQPITGASSFTGFATATSAATKVAAFIVEKVAGENGEGELTRGVHGPDPKVWTLRVRNNPRRATNAFTLVDALPPGLEFLGCASYYLADNTTNAPATGTAEEYVGSGPMVTGAATATCRTPATVETLAVATVLADGATAPAGSTRVTWTPASLGAPADLAAGEVRETTYLAGIPMFANAPFGSGAPTAASLGQGRNLDNNTGAATSENATEQLLTNRVAATGTYQGPSTSGSNPTLTDTANDTVTAEDLVIRKSTAGAMIQGTIVSTTFVIEAGEYRDLTQLVVTDTLPDGLCPLGSLAAGGPASTECSGGAQPTITTGSGTVTAPYASATENSNGTWTLVWNAASVSGLSALAHDGVITMTFEARVRTNYQEGFGDAAPVLSGDSATNNVAIQAFDFARADVTISDPEPDGELDFDASSSGFEAPWAAIDKKISTRIGPLATGSGLTASTVGDVCAGGTVTWEEGISPAIGYAPGDFICFDLQATFPINLDYAGVRLFDLLPSGYSVVSGSPRRVTAVGFTPDTITGTSVTTTSNSVSFLAGGASTVNNVGNVFHWTFAAIVGPPGAGQATDIKVNQWKLATRNSDLEVFQLRDLAGGEWTEPQLELTKGVRSVASISSTNTPGPLPANTDNVLVERNDVVEFRVDISNSGNVAADNIEVWDVLPAGIACTDIAAISDGGTCVSSPTVRIEWPTTSNVSLGAGASRTLTYTMAIPSDVEPSHVFVNTAGVRRYDAVTNGTAPYVYYPINNIDSTVAPNTDAASDTSSVRLGAPALTKLQQSAVTETGNSSNGSFASTNEQATIGEVVRYRVRATIPEGTTTYAGVITDDLPDGLLYMGSPTVTGSNGALAASILTAPTVGNSGNVVVTLPTPYLNAEASGDDWVEFEFDVRVADITGPGGNTRGTNLDNAVSVSWNGPTGAAVTPVVSNAARTTVVEPAPNIAKGDDTGATAGPGDFVNYTLTVTNPTAGGNVSPLHEGRVVDVVPAGLSIVNGSTPVADGGIVTPDDGVWDATARTITWTAATTAALTVVAPGATVTLGYRALVLDPAVAGSSLQNSATVTGTSLAGSPTGERTTYAHNDTHVIDLPEATIAKSVDRATATVGEPAVYTVSVTVPAGTRVYDGTILDTLGAGLVFDSYGTASSGVGSDPACPSVAGVAGISPVISNANGTTSTAWWIGDYIAPASGPCVITVNYQVRVGHQTAGTTVTPVVRGNVLSNSARFAWNNTDVFATMPSVPPTTSFSDVLAPVATAITVIEPTLVIDKDVNVTGCDQTAGNAGDGDTCGTDPGATYTYTLTIRNTGNAPASDIVVTDQPDAQLTNVVPATIAGVTVTDGWTAGDPDLQWTIDGPLASGGTITITYTAGLVASAQLADTDHVINTADVPTYFAVPFATRSATPGVTYRTYGSDPSGPGGNVVADTVDLTVRTPNVTVAKTAISDATDARVGQDFTWQITSTNASGATVANAFDLDVTDTLPAGWTYVNNSARVTTPYATNVAVEPACAPTCGSSLVWQNVVNGPAQPLAPGASITIRLAARPTASLLNVTNTGTFAHVNSVGVVAADATGATGNLTGAYSGVDATAAAFIRRIDLSVDKTVQSGPYYYGATVDYTVTIRNDGPDAATGVTLEDILPAGLLYRSTTSVSRGTYSSTTGLWTIGTINNGETLTLVLRVQIGAIGSITNTAQVRHADQWDIDSIPSDTVGSGSGEDDFASVAISSTVSSLGDLVWFDIDGDTTRDPNEPGIPNVRVVLESAGNDDVFGTSDDFWGPDGLAGGSDNITVTDTITNASGAYGFSDLPAGRYRTVVDAATLPAGMTATFNDDATSGVLLDNSSGIATIGSPAFYLGADFGYTGTGSLGDTVWYDRNASATATVDVSENGISGVALTVTWAGFDGTFGTLDDLVLGTPTAGTTGDYSVVRLPAGGYRVDVDPSTLPIGLRVPTFDLDSGANPVGAAQNTASTTLTAGQNRTDVDFSYTGTGSIGDRVWFDTDGDGGQDVGEPGLTNIEITITWAGRDNDLATTADNLVFVTTTASDGAYLVEHLPPGNYSAQVDAADLPGGVVPTADLDGTASAHRATTTLADGQARRDADFGYTGVASIGDRVWLDLDGNGAAAPGASEPGIPNVTVRVTWAGQDGSLASTADNLVISTTTAADGTYLVNRLPYGPYDVDIVTASLPSGTAPSFDLDGTASPSIASAPLAADNVSTTGVDEANRRDVDFSYVGTSSIADLVWEDQNGDGVKDPAEPGLDGVTVLLTWYGFDGVRGTVDDLTKSFVTGSGGLYLFDYLPAGAYDVVVVASSLPAGLGPVYDRDTPTNGVTDGAAHVSLGAADDRVDVDFGYRLLADLAVTKTHRGDFAVGAVAQYTIRVVNNGPATAAAPVQLVDTLPAGLSFRSATGEGVSCSGGQTVTCTRGSLASGAEAIITIDVDVTAAAAPQVTNTVTVSSPTHDPRSENNSATDPTNVPYADLRLTKTLDGELHADGEAVYVLAVRNAGPSTATGPVTIVDDLPDGLSFVSGEGDGWACSDVDGVVRCVHDADMPVGDFEVRLTVFVSAEIGASIENRAEVLGSVEARNVRDGDSGFFVDPDLASNASVAAGEVTRLPDLAFTGRTIAGAVLVAAALLAGGLVLVGVGRRRRAQIV